MKKVSVILSETEYRYLRKKAVQTNTRLSKMIRDIIFEIFEDEYDIKTIEKYEQEIREGKVDFIPFNKL